MNAEEPATNKNFLIYELIILKQTCVWQRKMRRDRMIAVPVDVNTMLVSISSH